MTAAYLDSHKYAKRLVETGIPPAAADVMAEAMFELASQVAALSARVEEQCLCDELAAITLERAGSRAIDYHESSAMLTNATLDSKISAMASELRLNTAQSVTEITRWVGACFILIMFLLQAILIACLP